MAALSKIGELLGAAEQQIVKTAVETLFQKGTAIEIKDLEVQVRDVEGKPILQLTLTGTVTVRSLKEG